VAESPNNPLFEYVGISLDVFLSIIFSVAESPSNPLFDEADAADFLRLSSVPPSNAFEEMIQWTKEGKLWHFPIDNEQGRPKMS
jgi:small subunit ribosomal protein S31